HAGEGKSHLRSILGRADRRCRGAAFTQRGLPAAAGRRQRCAHACIVPARRETGVMAASPGRGRQADYQFQGIALLTLSPTQDAPSAILPPTQDAPSTIFPPVQTAPSTALSVSHCAPSPALSASHSAPSPSLSVAHSIASPPASAQSLIVLPADSMTPASAS